MIRSESQTGTGHLKVTFTIPAEGVHGAVAVVGDFNGWSPTADPLRRRNKWLSASTVVKSGGRYRFRYLGDGGHWFNDSEVGVYEPNGMGDANSILDFTSTGVMSGNPDHRLDLHNPSVDSRITNAHVCGTVDLRTGATCIRPVHHHSSCRFVSHDDALDASAVNTG